MIYIVFALNTLVIMTSVIAIMFGLHDFDNVCIIMCLLLTIINLVCSFKL